MQILQDRINYYSEKIKFNRIALTQVYEILQKYEDGIENIPKNILYIIEDNRDKDYVFAKIEEIEEAELMEEAKEILTYLYTNFLSTPEEKMVLKQLEEVQYKEQIKKEKQETEIKTKELYGMEIFKERVIEHEDEEIVNLDLPVIYKEESFIKKIVNKILNKIKEKLFRKE